MEPDFYRTEISGALSSVFQKRLKGMGMRQLFVIPDGQVSNTDQVLELTRSNAVSNRCFAIGLGNGANVGVV
jgi:Fe2+ transport system protein FeoA